MRWRGTFVATSVRPDLSVFEPGELRAVEPGELRPVESGERDVLAELRDIDRRLERIQATLEHRHDERPGAR